MRGYTLSELMIAISIALLISLVAVPSFSEWMGRTQVQGATSEVLRNLASARLLALQTGRRVTFCGLNRHKKCSRTGIKEIAVFEDTNRDRQLDGNDVLHTRTPLIYDGHVSLNASNTHHISFAPDGSAVTYGSLYFCARNNAPMLARRVTVSAPGRAYVALPDKKTGLVTKSNRSPIICPPS